MGPMASNSRSSAVAPLSQLASLSAADTAHVIVGSGQLGGTGSGTLNAGSISVTSTNIGGGLVGEPG